MKIDKRWFESDRVSESTAVYSVEVVSKGDKSR